MKEKKKKLSFSQLQKASEQRVNKYFIAIREYTKYCCACGHNYDMKNSRHKHLPFCEKCRVSIITKAFGTIEKKPKPELYDN